MAAAEEGGRDIKRASDAASKEPQQPRAIRSYLTATITPIVLQALVRMEAEDPPRPVQWLADYLENAESS